MEEKTTVGGFDLPQSLSYVIARLIQQKFPREAAAINRDGTMTIVFDDKDKMERYTIVELQFGKMIFKYEAVETKQVSGEAKCLHCKSNYIKTVYYVSYKLKEVTKGSYDLTERYKIGGDMTESKVGISAIKQQIALTDLQKRLLYYS
ncbi:MAG: hypothetical protein ACFFCD_13235 [Promethearchaeota archaeon]